MTESRSATLTTWLLTNVDNPNGLATAGNLLGGDGAPKLKFLFTVEFAFRQILNIHKGSEELQTIQFDLKSATRPNITINYEDANFYNYRTKVATRTNFGNIKLTFYEDSLNTANNLLWEYMKAVSPITGYSGDPSIDTSGEEVTGILPSSSASTIGPLAHPDGPILWMKVHHHYIEYGPGGVKKKVTTYTYANPKIETVELDELDMSSSDASTVSATFVVDTVRVEHRDYA